MKQLIVMVLGLALSVTSIAQENSDAADFQSLNSNSGGIISANTAVNSPLFPINTNISSGVNFGRLSSGNYFQSFLSPSIGFPVNKRLSVSTGITYSYSRLNDVPVLELGTGSIKRISGDINTLTINAAGLYRVNDKMHVTGSVYKTLNPSFNARLSSDALQMEAKGMSVGIGYQLNENTYIGAEFRMEQGNSVFYNPYNNSFNRYSNPFNQGSYFPGFNPF
ncbi:MAG TPA: hypothetical protein VK212_10515 [Lentimicrobium sp.]|nr:hypothetical protein [Lentimicrobium sp.]